MTIKENQLVVQVHIRGFKNSFIARQLNRTRQTILFLINEWKKGRFVSIKKPRQIPSKLTVQQVFKVRNYFINNPFDTYMQCIKTLKLPVHRNTIGELLSKNGIRYYVACSKQFLPMQNQIKRLKFAIKYQHWTVQ